MITQVYLTDQFVHLAIACTDASGAAVDPSAATASCYIVSQLTGALYLDERIGTAGVLPLAKLTSQLGFYGAAIEIGGVDANQYVVLFKATVNGIATIIVEQFRINVDPRLPQIVATAVYDEGTDALTISAWEHLQGQIDDEPLNCTVHVYDADGAEAFAHLTDDAPDAQGIFKLTKTAAGLDVSKSYYAVVTIYDGFVSRVAAVGIVNMEQGAGITHAALGDKTEAARYGCHPANLFYIDPVRGDDVLHDGHSFTRPVKTYYSLVKSGGLLSLAPAGRKVIVALGDVWTYDTTAPADLPSNAVAYSNLEFIGHGHRLYTIVPENWSTNKYWNEGAVVRFANQRFTALRYIAPTETPPAAGADWALSNAHCGDVYAADTHYAWQDLVINSARTGFYISLHADNGHNALPALGQWDAHWAGLACTISFGGGVLTAAHDMLIHGFKVVKDTGNGVDCFARDSYIEDNHFLSPLMTVPYPITVNASGDYCYRTDVVQHSFTNGDKVELTATVMPTTSPAGAVKPGVTYFARADETYPGVQMTRFCVYDTYAHAVAASEGGVPPAAGKVNFTDAGTAVVMWQYPVVGGSGVGFAGAVGSVARGNHILDGAGVGVFFYSGARRCVAEDNIIQGAYDSILFDESQDCVSRRNQFVKRNTAYDPLHAHVRFTALATRPVSEEDQADVETGMVYDAGATLPKVVNVRTRVELAGGLMATSAAVTAASGYRVDAIAGYISPTMTAIAVLKRHGQRIVADGACTVTVFSAAGVQMFQEIDAAADANGVFSITKSSPGLVAGNAYYAVISIVHGGVTFPDVQLFTAR